MIDYLIALGVDPKRLKMISYGKERPTCAEPNEACWSQNRRGVTTLDNDSLGAPTASAPTSGGRV